MPQAGQVPPPQSTPVSDPFLTPSEQVGCRQVLNWQTPEQHWEPTTQVPPGGVHPGWQDPRAHAPLQHWLFDAQRSPFGRHAATHTLPEQLPLQHDAEDVHAWPSAEHGWQSPPEQTLLQQSAGWPQIVPAGAQQAVWHEPAQLLLQQSLAPRQEPGAAVQFAGHDPKVLRTRGWTRAPCFTLPLGPSPVPFCAVTMNQ